MKIGDYSKLEKDFDFKKSYLNSTPWWKSILMVPPVCLLFIGLVGILYLFRNDQLASLYVIPYLLFFIVGTVWLKAIRKHIQKTMMSAKGAFQICLAKSVGEKEGRVYFIFANNEKRHNQYYISNLAQSLSADDLLENAEAKKKSVLMRDFYLRAYSKKEIDKKNPRWQTEGYLPVLYINDKYTLVVKGRHLS